MDSIVDKLSEIEHAANAIVEHAEAQKPELEKKWQAKRNKFDAELEQDTVKKLDAIKAELENKMARILDEQTAVNAKTIKALEIEYNEHHKQYAQEILSHIIEV